MAGNIKGITIEIGGDTTKLQSALRGVDSTIRSSSKSLKDINRALKLDPANTILLTQKQKELKNAIQATKEKLKTLKDASKQVTPEKIGQDKYNALQQEIGETKEKLKTLKDASKQVTPEEIGQDKYDALQQEIGETEAKLKKLKDASKQVTPEKLGQDTYDALQQEIGETEAKLKGLEDEYKQFGSVAAQQTKAAAEKMKEVGQGLETAGRAMTTYVTAPIVGAGTVAVKASMDFETSMSKVSAISGATGDDLQQLKDKAREMGKTTKFSATDSADAMSYMAMAGWKTSDMLNGIEGIMALAAASGEDLATTSDIVTDALTAFGMSAEDSGRFADILAAASANANTNVSMLGESFKYVAPVAGALGYSAEDVSVALGLMANAGIKSSQAGTSLRNILTNLAKPTKDSEAAMSRLGISMTDSEGNMLSFREIMDQLRSSFGEINMPVEEFNRQVEELDTQLADGSITQSQYDKSLEELTKQAYGAEGAEKARAAAMLAGKNGMSGLLAIVNASEEDYNKLTDAVEHSSDTFVKTADGSIKTMSQALEDGDEILEEYKGTAEATAAVMQDNLGGKITTLTSSLGELAIAFGETLTPAVEKATQIVQGITDKLNGLTDGQRQVISIILAVVAVIGPLLLIVGKVLIFVSMVTTAMTTLGPILAGVGAAIGAISLPVLIIIGVIAALIAIGVALYQNWDTIKQKASEVGAWLQEKWNAACDNVKNAVIGAKETIAQKWDEIKTAVKDKASQAADTAKQKFENIRTNVSSKVELAKQAVYQKWDAIKQKLGSITPSTITDKFAQIKKGIEEKINGAKKAVSDAIDQIKQKFNFSWSLPHLALPHISISGSFSINPPSVPHFGISWYKKAMNVPYMLDGAQIFGMMGGKALVGGEAGREVIVGWDALQRHMNAGTTVVNNNVTVNAAPGMDERQVADAVMRRMQTEINRKGRVWA